MRDWKVQGLALGLVIFVAYAVCAAAQTKPDVQQDVKKIVINDNNVMISGADGTQPQTFTFTFVSSEMGFESKVVAGAPFSADAVTEFTQVLANGQRIYRKSTSAMYRDSAGRTRREQTIEAIGSLGSAAEAKQTILINDPMANVSYILNPENHTAVKRTIPAGMSGVATAADATKVFQASVSGRGQGSMSSGEFVTPTELPRKTEAGIFVTTKVDSANVRKEALGTQMISGVQAEGTRITETIATGLIGNDSPIEVISESWVSTELGVVVKTVHNDPMSGENVYQLTNIRRGEPSATLFQVPADYRVTEVVEKSMKIIKMDGK
jgi:hypothetical protein